MLTYLLSRNQRDQGIMLVLVVASALVTLVPIHLFRIVLDRVIPTGDLQLLLLIAGSLALVITLGTWLNHAKAVKARQIQEFFVADLRGIVMRHLMQLPSEYFAANPVGKLTNRILHDAARFGMGIEWLLVNPVVAGATVLVYSTYLFSIHVALALALAIPLPLAVLLTLRITRALGAHRKDVLKAQGVYSSSINELVLGAVEVQSNGTVEREYGRLAKEHGALSRTGVKEASLLAGIAAASDAYRQAGLAAIYCYGAWLAIAGELSVGQIVAFAAASGGLFVAMNALLSYPPLYENVRDRYNELHKILEVPRIGAKERGTASAAPEKRPNILVDGVCFSHWSGARVLEGINLSVAHGEHIALVGRSGGGKSTLLNLIAGRLQPESGAIQYGSIPHTSLDMDARVALMSYVQQTPFLFTASLRDNLLYGLDGSHGTDDHALLRVCASVALADDLLAMGLEYRVEAFDAELVALRERLAARLQTWLAVSAADGGDVQADVTIRAHLSPPGYPLGDDSMRRRFDDMVREEARALGLTDRLCALGLNTDVGDRGSRLSGGQKQKVSIARALLRRRPILLLDEPTASLDKASAESIVGLLRSCLNDITVIAVTHDIDLLPAFDRVVALRDGRIVADLPPAKAVEDAQLIRAVLDR